MQSLNRGLIAGVALVVAAVLLGIVAIWRWGPESSETPEPTALEQAEVTISPTAPPVPTSPPPVTYTVQAGDTLSVIAQAHDVSVDQLIVANSITNPDFLQIGQTLVIPHGDTPPPADHASEPDAGDDVPPGELPDVEVPTLTPSGSSHVEVTQVAGVGDLGEEMVVLESGGGAVSLDGWTLSTALGEDFVFPPLTLFPQGTVRVHSRYGHNTPRDLFWGRIEPAWQPGELLTLRNAEGSIVDTYVVPGP